MYPPGKQDMNSLRLIGVSQFPQQGLHHGIPQHKTRQRPDMPSALPALEHKPVGALLEEQTEQPWGRDVQV